MARYELTAIDVKGAERGRRTDSVPPDLAGVGAFGDGHRAGYVLVRHERGWMAFGRDRAERWHILCDGAPEEAAYELVLWFELLHHYPGPGQDDPGHPLAGAPAPGPRGQLGRADALRLAAERAAAGGMDLPVDVLAAERFAGGWYVYVPEEVDDSDPMAFLDSLTVDAPVFLVGDLGRVREASTSLPPQVLRERFRAEEVFVRRRPAEEAHLAEFAAAFARAARDDDRPAAASFTVVDDPEALAARAAGLVDPIVQQLSLLGPPGWDGFTAVFSCTVGAEVAQLRFRYGGREEAVRVPESLAVLVRRQRHLAARMPAGPWYRLVLAADTRPGGAGVLTDYDYADDPLPADQLLPAPYYREDLLAYPRPTVPAWLTLHLSDAADLVSATAPTPAQPAPTKPQPEPAQSEPEPVRPRAPRVVVDSERHRLYADTSRIARGAESIALDAIEWVSYSVTRSVTHRLLGMNSYTTTHGFGVGPGGRGLADLSFTSYRKAVETPPEWTALVELVQRYVEPRLVEEQFGLIAAGGTAMIGELRVDGDGMAARVNSGWKGRNELLAWPDLAPVRVENGMVVLYRTGEQKPLFHLPLHRANVVLLPALLPALARLFTGRARG
ncbi:hypothetical protein AB0O31_00705 [Kitasatospora cineracea]|uniref:hypothetical protein n=1 Tax=Kitasatospora cineracea TaxID=88074 RepID=UPI00341B3EC1